MSHHVYTDFVLLSDYEFIWKTSVYKMTHEAQNFNAGMVRNNFSIKKLEVRSLLSKKVIFIEQLVERCLFYAKLGFDVKSILANTNRGLTF